jgi:hypothetical protein
MPNLMNLLASTPPAGGSGVKEKVCDQLKTLDAASCDPANDSAGILNGIVGPVIQTLILVVGAVSVVVIVVGGLMYVLSAGDANNTKRAKDTILYAAIGLIIALIAQAIVTFVIGAV